MISEDKIIGILNEYNDIKEELIINEKPVIVHLTKNNSQDANNPAILFYGEKGIFIFVMDYPEAEEIVSLRKIAFGKLKGIKIQENKDTVIDLLTNGGGLFRFFVPKTDKIKNHPNFNQNREEFINCISKLETKERIKSIDKLEQKNIKQKVIFFIPMILLCVIFIQLSKNMGRLEFFLKLIGLIILYGFVFYIIKMGSMAIKDREFAKEFNIIMKNFAKNQDNAKLYQNLKDMNTKPVNLKNRNTFFLSISAAAYGMGNIDEAKEMFDKINIVDNTDLGNTEKMQYLHLREEIYKDS